MNKKDIIIKKTYCQPFITQIKLDNEISLALQSDVNPSGEPTFSQSTDYFKNDPFRTNIV